jgi:glucose/arabinose dehydrogenase
VLDVSDLTVARGERGLLGLSFSPDGSLAFTNHTDAGTGATVVSEYQVGPDGAFDRASRRVLLEVAQPFGNHNGGHLVTGPDGGLYIGMGDGGSGGDPERFALDLTTLLGKLVRIDPSPSNDLPYTVPDDNPFVDVDGALPEIFAIGLRNPWKFGFDPVTDDLWITDVGQNRFEEINYVPDPGDGSVAGAGLSFGWSAFEGTERFNDDVDPEGHTDPVLTYDHRQGECSISGGAPYRGEAIPELVGGYVYSDFCSGRVFVFDFAGERTLVLGQLSSVTAVLPGPEQELYVISINGPVHRIDPA